MEDTTNNVPPPGPPDKLHKLLAWAIADVLALREAGLRFVGRRWVSLPAGAATPSQCMACLGGALLLNRVLPDGLRAGLKRGGTLDACGLNKAARRALSDPEWSRVCRALDELRQGEVQLAYSTF